MSETLTTIQIRRGIKADLPSVAEVGEILLTTDTHELFFGTGTGVVQLVAGSPAATFKTDDATNPVQNVLNLKSGAQMTLTPDGAGGVTFASAGSPPGGADTQVQYNDAGIFDGDPAFTYQDETQRLEFGATMAGALASFQVGGAGAAFVGVGGTQSTCGIDCGEDRADQVLIANVESPSNGIKIANVGADGSGAIVIGFDTDQVTDPPYESQITIDAGGIATSTTDLLDLASGGVGSASFLRGGTNGSAGFDINSNVPDGITLVIAEPASGGILIQDAPNALPGKVKIGTGNSVGAPTRFIEISDALPGINLEDDTVGGAVFMTADFTAMGSPAGEGILIHGGTEHAMVLSGNGITPFSVEIATAGDKVSFFGTSPAVVKPTVSGSRGGNAALASLLTALATLGLITDGTSA